MSAASAVDDPDDWNAACYARHTRFVSDYGASVVDWLIPRAGERILDLGCGDGALTAGIAAQGPDVLGVDASAAFVQTARERGLEAVVLDGHALDFDNAFDAVFSNAALHWMKQDPDAVLAGVWRALKPAGRFVAEFGAQGNIAPIHAALRAEAARHGLNVDRVDPWFFPAPADYAARLERVGFEIERDTCFERPTPLPGDIRDWLTTLARPFLGAFAPATRAHVIEAVHDRLKPVLQGADGEWTAPYVRYRFVAHRTH